MATLERVSASRFVSASLPGIFPSAQIALTANAFAEDKARCLAAGMDGFLVKPFSIEDLFTTLLRVLQQQGRSRVMGETSEESVS